MIHTNPAVDKILGRYRPQPSPLKETLASLGVRQVEVARYLEVPLGTLNNWLNGWVQMPNHMEKRLKQLVKRIETVNMEESTR